MGKLKKYQDTLLPMDSVRPGFPLSKLAHFSFESFLWPNLTPCLVVIRGREEKRKEKREEEKEKRKGR